MEKQIDYNLKYDNADSIKLKFEKCRELFKTHRTKDVDYRLTQLRLLRAAFVKYEKQIHYSIEKDLGINEFLSFAYNYKAVLGEIDEAIKNLKKWAAPRSADTPALFAPSKSYILPEPYGVTTIFSAWNSQYLTLIMPLVSALSAGNTIIAKPSEMSPYAAKVVELILSELDDGVVCVIQGGADVCVEILKHRSDLIIFTGSPQKGRDVARAASEYLTPCILELGGQNPVIVDASADITNAAINLVNGRTFFTGQVCLSPEYIFVHSSIRDRLIQEMRRIVNEFYSSTPEKSPDFGRVINEFHTKRLSDLFQNPGGKLVYGGKNFSIENRFVEPTLYEFETIPEMKKSKLTENEIFGPIQYLVPYSDIKDCIDYINSKEKPLVLYYFGKDNNNKEMIKKCTSSGAFVTNDTIVHFANHYLPFGGVGNSGYGVCHGKFGFDNASHLKPIMERKEMIMGIRYPPFDNKKKKLFTMAANYLTFSQGQLVRFLAYTILFFVIVYYRSTLIGFVRKNN